MDNSDKRPDSYRDHFDQRSAGFRRYVTSHFQHEGAPAVDPYIRAGLKPDLVKAKKSLWKKLRAIVYGS